MSPDVLAVFVKAPAPGRVKTRLARDIGPVPAAELYARLGREVITGTTCRSRYSTAAWYAPAESSEVVQAWLSDLGVAEFLAQPERGLGKRLSTAFSHHFRRGARRVVIIGSDCPGVSRSLVADAFAALGRQDMVLGPAVDGGFYLIGLSAPAPGLFRRVAWSTEVACHQTRRNAGRLGRSVATLPMLRDIDSAADAVALGWLEPAPIPG